jgi:hypothetical protein
MLLALYIPAFMTPFLGTPAATSVPDHQDLDKSAQLLPMLCDVVRDHLVPRKPNLSDAGNTDGKENARENLAMAIVQLMESLCWGARHDLVDQYVL